MNKILRGLGIVVVFAVVAYAKDPNFFTKQVRDAVGTQQATPEQVEMRKIKERLDRGLQFTPPDYGYRTPEWIVKELEKGRN